MLAAPLLSLVNFADPYEYSISGTSPAKTTSKENSESFHCVSASSSRGMTVPEPLFSQSSDLLLSFRSFVLIRFWITALMAVFFMMVPTRGTAVTVS